MSISPDLARLLVTERHEDAEQRRRRAQARRDARAAVTVPAQRRGSGRLSRLVPRIGVRVPTR